MLRPDPRNSPPAGGETWPDARDCPGRQQKENGRDSTRYRLDEAYGEMKQRSNEQRSRERTADRDTDTDDPDPF